MPLGLVLRLSRTAGSREAVRLAASTLPSSVRQQCQCLSPYRCSLGRSRPGGLTEPDRISWLNRVFSCPAHRSLVSAPLARNRLSPIPGLPKPPSRMHCSVPEVQRRLLQPSFPDSFFRGPVYAACSTLGLASGYVLPVRFLGSSHCVAPVIPVGSIDVLARH
jgi:hypothetical protein